MKSLTNSENPSSDPLQMLWSGDLAINTLKETRLWSEIDTGSRLGHVQLRGFFLHSIRGGHWSISFNDRKGSWNRNFLYIFLLTKAVSIFKSQLCMFRKYWFNLIGFQKQYSFVCALVVFVIFEQLTVVILNFELLTCFFKLLTYNS